MRRWSILLAGGLLAMVLCAACGRATPRGPAPVPPGAALPTLDEGLAALPDGTPILVDETLLARVPERLRAHRIVTASRDSVGFLQPDDRVDPATIDFLLAVENVVLEAIRFGDPPLWTPLARETNNAAPTLVLLRRAAPLAEQLAPPLDETILADQLDDMAEVRFERPADVDGTQRSADFALDRFEVTHDQYATFLNRSRPSPDRALVWYALRDPESKIVRRDGLYRVYRGAERLPVFNVSFHGARAFCEHFGKHLPTLDQWRQAGGHWTDGREFPWGDARDFARRGNFAGDDDGYKLWAPVDAFPGGQSPHGVLNMAGNVFEWVGDHQALLGGSFEHAPEPMGAFSAPEGNDPLARNRHDGFRCARD